VAAAPEKPAVQEQEVALVELQVIVDEAPEAMGFGEALMETVGRGAKLAVTLLAAVMDTEQAPVPVQAPDQPAKLWLAPGVAVKETFVP